VGLRELQEFIFFRELIQSHILLLLLNLKTKRAVEFFPRPSIKNNRGSVGCHGYFYCLSIMVDPMAHHWYEGATTTKIFLNPIVFVVRMSWGSLVNFGPIYFIS